MKQEDRYAMIQDTAKVFKSAIRLLTTTSEEQARALRKIDEAVMWASVALAIDVTLIDTLPNKSISF